MIVWSLVLWAVAFACSAVAFRSLLDIPRLSRMAQAWTVSNGVVIESDHRHSVIRYTVQGATFRASVEMPDATVGSAVPVYYETGNPGNAAMHAPQGDLRQRSLLSWALSVLLATLVAYTAFQFSAWSAPRKRSASTYLGTAGPRY